MFFNRAIVIGNLTRDPELRSLPSGVQVTTIGLATNRVWKDKNGVKQESSDFHNIVVFGRQAETAAQYLRKGSSILAEGRMQTRSWDGADGQKKYRTEIVADRIQFGPKPGNVGAAAGDSSAKAVDGQSKQEVPQAEAIEYPEENINIDDIPF